MRECKECGIDISGRHRLAIHCEDCARQQRRGYANAYRRRRVKKAQQLLQEYKKHLCCVECGESCPVCLDFHHCNGKKRKEISQLTAIGKSWEYILNEIKKCKVLCANCHRKMHAGLLD